MRWGAIVLNLLVFVPAVASAPAWGQGTGPMHFNTGNDLLSSCQGSYQMDHCEGYIAGVSDEIEAVRKYLKLSPCLHAGVSITQVRDAVVRYITDHPELRDENASQLIADAITVVWQCH